MFVQTPIFTMVSPILVNGFEYEVHVTRKGTNAIKT